MVVTLGALIADVAHTRPVPITGLASDPELVERLGFDRSNYEGPTGIVGVAPRRLPRQRGITSASLWAAVPHYVAAVPNPKAALALLRRARGPDRDRGRGLRARGGCGALRGAGRPGGRREPRDPGARRAPRGGAGGVVELDEDVDVPSGDAIASDFQRFLRQRSDPGTEPAASGRCRGLPDARARRRADPVVAPRADLVRRARLEVLALDAVGDLEDRALDALEVVGLRRRPGPSRRRARTSSCRRRRRCPRPRARRSGRARSGGRRRARRRRRGAGLVVDQLVAAVGSSVDAVDAAAQVVVADLKLKPRSSQTGLAGERCGARSSGSARRRRGRGTAARRRSEPKPVRRQPASNSEQPVEAAGSRPSLAGRRRCASPRSGSARARWWTRIPKRWLIVGSCGIAKTRANLYLSGQVR